MKFTSEADVAAAVIERRPLWTDKRDDTGPFDIIGDVHGCAAELEELLIKLGYNVAWFEDDGERAVAVTPPEDARSSF